MPPKTRVVRSLNQVFDDVTALTALSMLMTLLGLNAGTRV